MKVLIVVDVQYDFLPGGALAVPEGDRVIPVINSLMDRFDKIIATQDWHPAGHGSFAASHEGKKPGDRIDLDGLPQILWPVHCVQETRGAEFSGSLRTEKFDKVFRKGTDVNIDSYSGFYDNGHRKSTGLSDFIRELEPESVYITGLATDYCVKFTALDSIKEGFRTLVVSDAVRAVNLTTGDDEKALEEMRDAGVTVITSDKILA